MDKYLFLFRSGFFCSLFFIFNPHSEAQSALTLSLTRSDSANKGKIYTVAGVEGGLCIATLVSLNQLWYSDYPHASFHFFNDNKEWLQMDKAGHVYSSYFESAFTANALTWTGIAQKKSALLGGVSAFVFQSTFEVLDGFSQKWGFSYSDVAANTAGCVLFVSQELLWNEQRAILKFSFHPGKYSSELQHRTNALFGSSLVEELIKDYNGQTYWLSINPFSFIKNKNSKFPHWLNIDVGYGSEGMLGGFKNTWKDNASFVDRTDISRIRQFYFSPDIDLSRIKSNSAVLRTAFGILNIIKVPAPALEITSQGRARLHIIYF